MTFPQKLLLKGQKMVKTNYPPAFVTYGWCRTAWTTVRSLGEKGIKVHVGDTSPLAMSRFSRHCASFTRLPDFFDNPNEYLESICEALRKTGATVLMPCHEDVEIVSKNLDKLPPGVSVAVPDFEMWDAAEDKQKYVDHVIRNGCPAPRTFEIFSDNELENFAGEMKYPAVIKTRIGNSAKGVRIVTDPSSLVSEFKELVDLYSLPKERWPLVQEFVRGKKIGVLGVYNKGKHVSSVIFDIRRSKGADNFGTSTFRVTVDDDDIKNNAIKAMESFNWHGVVDMDFIKTDEGDSYLIDINGRLGGATALTCFSGVDLPYLWYLSAIDGLSGDYPKQEHGVKARWIIGDFLGCLDSLRRAKFKECLRFITPQWKCYHDDFCLGDPLPFFFEALDYASKFFKGGKSMNPIQKNMIR
jgi:predicted ATP-grasp superfamily ATP-dependent carboligase